MAAWSEYRVRTHSQDPTGGKQRWLVFWNGKLWVSWQLVDDSFNTKQGFCPHIKQTSYLVTHRGWAVSKRGNGDSVLNYTHKKNPAPNCFRIKPHSSFQTMYLECLTFPDCLPLMASQWLPRRPCCMSLGWECAKHPPLARHHQTKVSSCIRTCQERAVCT